MTILQQTAAAHNSVVEAAMDAVDLGYMWGYEDATGGTDNQATYYFVANTSAWCAYNDGYQDGSVTAAILTGQSRTYAQFAAKPPSVTVAYAPFQLEAAAYADVLPAWQRDEWVGD